jgi:HAMP domain-containing protein
MKLRLTFTIKIILPYLLLASLFFVILLSGLEQDHSTVAWLSAAGMLACLVTCLIQIFWLRRPLYRIREMVLRLTRGMLTRFTASKATDEIGDLEQHLEKHVGNLQSVAGFTRSMATGDFSVDFQKLSNDDELGEALLSLKSSLMKSLQETESRRIDEEHRSWTAQGLAKFSKLFREVEDNLEELSMELMKELVGYTEADVGALFIAKDPVDGQQELEVRGSYAFDREKFVQRSFQFGEGLVGRTALEKELVYITELPPDYIKIRSGLGEDAPSSILLVPVMLDNNVLGIIELAALGEIPAYQIEFIRQLADALATTLAKVKANLQSHKLFEQTKKQAEALSSQEKMFRQNLEKLENAQKEFADREASLLKEIEQLKKGR